MSRVSLSKRNIFLFLIPTLIVILLPVVTFAAVDNPPVGGVDNPHTLQNPISVNSFPELIQKIFQAAVAIGVPIAIFFIVLAGFKMVWAQGRPEELKKARSNLVWTLVGIAIFVGASIIVSVVVETLCEVGVQGVGSC